MATARSRGMSGPQLHAVGLLFFKLSRPSASCAQTGDPPPSRRTRLPSSGERKFLMRRQTRKRALSAEQRPPAETRPVAKSLRFGAVNAKQLMKVSTRGLGGGERSQIRTGLRWQFPANREKNREFCDFWASGDQFCCKKPLCCRHFSRNSLRKLTGKIF
jgi:hypothetical protein